MGNPANVVACVFKSGKWTPRNDVPYSVQYGPEHVLWLQAQFQRNCSEMGRFVCLTDVEIPGVECIPLEANLPGWWSKLELFRVFKRAAYADLDTVLVGDPSRYLFHNDRRFLVSTGINIHKGGAINTSLMTWDGNLRWIFERFLPGRDKNIAFYTKNSHWGDQGWIKDVTRGQVHFNRFQSRYPGSIMSYRRDFELPRRPDGPRLVFGQVSTRGNWQLQPRVVFFNGAKKPWECDEPWIPKLQPLHPAA